MNRFFEMLEGRRLLDGGVASILPAAEAVAVSRVPALVDGRRQRWAMEGAASVQSLSPAETDVIVQSVRAGVSLDYSNALPADANRNGRVDFGDFQILERAFGNQQPGRADFDADGDADHDDFAILHGSFGQSRAISAIDFGGVFAGGLTLGLASLAGGITQARLEVRDVNGNRAAVNLAGVTASSRRWTVMPAQLAGADLSRVTEIAVLVEDAPGPAKIRVELGPVLIQGTVPLQPGAFRVAAGDRRLFVRDRKPDGTLGTEYAYVAKGVNWSPHTAGAAESELHLEFARWRNVDIPLMANMGVNTVRVYHDFGIGADALGILDEFYRHGIRVIMAVDSPIHGVVASLSNVSAVVNAYKNHPAILMWYVGNEWDINRYYGTFSSITEAAQFTEQAAALIKSIDPVHPVASVVADPHIPGQHPLSQEKFPHLGGPYMDDIIAMVPSVDVWGLNIYRSSFGDALIQWRSISDKPAFIGEFGADSYDHRTSAANETMQAEFDARLWDEIYFDLSAQRTEGALIGGLLFEFNDEHWKNGTPAQHTITNEFNGGQPDGFNDEEWFGLVDINRVPKAAYWAMRGRFLEDAVRVNATPMVTVFSSGAAQFGIDGKVVFDRAGNQWGARGINVAVFDRHTGIRLVDMRSFDTWANHENFNALAAYLASLPDGSVIALAIADEGGFISYDRVTPWDDPRVETGYQAIEALGSTKIRQVKYHGSWAMIVVKGQGVKAEEFANTANGGTTRVAVWIEAGVMLMTDVNAGRRDVQTVIAPAAGVRQKRVIAPAKRRLIRA